MRIAFLFSALNHSGAPKMLTWVANQMARRGHEVHVIVYASNPKVTYLDEAVTLHELNIKRSRNRIARNTLDMVKIQHRLIKQLDQIKPDGIVSFSISGTYVHLAANRLFGRYPVIFSERTDPSIHKGIMGEVFKLLMRCADGTVFQTEGARSFFSGKIYKNSAVIPNPAIIKPEVAQNLASYRRTFAQRDSRIVSVGRLSIRQKRQDVLLDAFRIVHEKHPEMQLVLYGDGEDKERIQTLAEKKGLADSVVLAGKTDKVEEDICSARVFALTSDFEGIPNALIEAMSVGVPCVSTDCSPGGAALLIRDEENGFLVSRGNAAVVAEKILQLIEDPQISDRFAAEGPKIVEAFSENQIATLWEQYFFAVFQSKSVV